MYLCVSVCVCINTTVFCVTVLFGSYLPDPYFQVHRTETQCWSDVLAPTSS